MTKAEASLQEFLPAALEIQQQPPHPLARHCAVTLILLFVFLVCWASLGRVNIVATAQGKIIPDQKVKIIQAAVDGELRRVFITEDQLVKKGDPLFYFDDSQILANIQQLTLQQQQNDAELNRKQLLIFHIDQLDNASDDDPSAKEIFDDQSLSEQQAIILHEEFSDYLHKLEAKNKAWQKSHYQALAAQALIDQHENTLPLQIKKFQAAQTLFANKLIAEFDLLQLEQATIESQQQLYVHRSQKQLALAEADENLRLLNAMKASYKAQTRQEITQLQNTQQRLQQQMLQLQDEHRKHRVNAPVNGIVKDIMANYQGTVIKHGQQVMSLVPTDEQLLVEALLPNKDIAYVEEGMPAEVKIESIPFTRYGLVSAKVISISNDAVQADNQVLMYKVRLALDKDVMQIKEREVALLPGMSVTAELKTGTRRLLEFFIAPLLQASHESLRER